jgi:hypothetical protein
MEKLGLFFVAAFGVIGLILVLPILSALAGALSGMIVAWAFPGTTAQYLAFFGLQDFAMWQVGAAFAWCGSFLKTSVSTK